MAYKHHTTILPVRPCTQTNISDCGVAAVATILHSLGQELPYAEITRVLNPTYWGTPPANIRLGLNQLNISFSEHHHNTIESLERLLDNMHLCLVAYQAWGHNGRQFRNLETGHYSVVFGYDATHFYLADPSMYPTETKPNNSGVRKIRKDKFLSRWRDYDIDGNRYEQWTMAVALSQKP